MHKVSNNRRYIGYIAGMIEGEFCSKCGQTVGGQMSLVRLQGHDAAVVADCL